MIRADIGHSGGVSGKSHRFAARSSMPFVPARQQREEADACEMAGPFPTNHGRLKVVVGMDQYPKPIHHGGDAPVQNDTHVGVRASSGDIDTAPNMASLWKRLATAST